MALKGAIKMLADHLTLTMDRATDCDIYPDVPGPADIALSDSLAAAVRPLQVRDVMQCSCNTCR